MIEGGYILQPRSIKGSKIANAPPCAREIWQYLLREAFWKDKTYLGNTIKRGQVFKSITDIREDLCWYVGYRKETYTKAQTVSAMKLLRTSGMISTTKLPRGMLITICKYDYYQDKKNYEPSNEPSNEDTTKLPTKGDTNPSSIIEEERRKEEKKKEDREANHQTDDKNKINYEKFKEFYNSTVKGGMPKILKMSQKRKNDLKKLMKIYDKNEILGAIKKASESTFIQEGSWCNVDWLLKEQNIIKVIEGNYDNKTTYSQNGDSIEIEPGIEYIDKNIYKYPWHKNKKTQMWIKGHPYAATNQAEPQYADGMGRFITKEQFELLTKKEK